MVFHWSLSDSKSPQVSRTFLSILAVPNNVVVWMVFTRPPTSKSSSPFNNPLVTALNAPNTIGIIVTCMFHIIIIIIYFLRVFLTSVNWWSITGVWVTTFPLVSRTLLSILADYFTSCEFSTQALTDGLSLESEWQRLLESPGLFSVFWLIISQVSSRLQHYWNLILGLFSLLSRTLVVGVTLLQRCNRCYLLPQSTEQWKCGELCCLDQLEACSYKSTWAARVLFKYCCVVM